MSHHASILFVCLGNICRSPIAQGICEAELRKRQLIHRMQVDSCGTSHYHIGHAPDPRAIQAMKAHGYDISPQRARQLQLSDYAQYTYIVAMDRTHLHTIEQHKPVHFKGHIHLLRNFDPSDNGLDVPDPYYNNNFEHVFAIIERGVHGLLAHMCSHLSGNG